MENDYKDIAAGFSNYNLLCDIVEELIEQTHWGRIDWKISSHGYGWYTIIEDCEFYVDAKVDELVVKCQRSDPDLYRPIQLGQGATVEKLSRWLHDYYPLHYPIKPDLNFALLFANKTLQDAFPKEEEIIYDVNSD